MMPGHNATAGAACFFCGQPECAELLEYWSSREFMLDTCCEGMHEAVASFLADADPKVAGRWVGSLELSGAASARKASTTKLPVVTFADLMAGAPGYQHGVRRLIPNDEGSLILDWNLVVTVTTFREVRSFVAEHHRHCKPPRGWRWGAAVRNGSDVLGVISVGRPVARMLDQQRIAEVNRLCIRTDLPKGLEWNCASLMYGYAAREAKQRGHEWIITYLLSSESGVSLKAAGWQEGHRVRGRKWSCRSRPRDDNTPTEDKTCWYRQLVRNPVSMIPSVRRRGDESTLSRAPSATTDCCV